MSLEIPTFGQDAGKLYITESDFYSMAHSLCRQVVQWQSVNNVVVDTIVGAPRGSLQLMNFIAQYLGIFGQDVQSITVNSRDDEVQRSEVTFGQLPDVEKISNKIVLWTDDVRDTGVTEDAACRILTDLGAKAVVRADLGYKPDNDMAKPKRKPDLYVFETAEWVVFPWERIIELRRAHEELLVQGATKEQLHQLELNFMQAQGFVTDLESTKL